MAAGEGGSTSLATTSVWRKLQRLFATPAYMGVALGPLSGLLIWLLPLGIEPVAHKGLAILAFIIISWIVGAVEYGLTALCGCFLFWALRVTPFDVAFHGFAQPVPWFTFAALLTGQAVAHTGLAKRLGYVVIQRVGPSYGQLLFGILALVLLMQVLIPSANAQIVILIAMSISLSAAFGVERRSNIATGLFLASIIGCSFFSHMFLSSPHTILVHGLIQEQTKLQLLWSRWAIAFLPLMLLTLGAVWVIIYWVYPPEHHMLLGGRQSAREAIEAMGPWSRDERKVLCWLLLAIVLWGTDFMHHLPPALIGIGLGLLLALPKVGVLDATAFKSVNFSLVIFVGGALSLSSVLLSTQGLTHLMGVLADRMAPLLTGPWFGTLILYWMGVIYELLSGQFFVMLSTGLPVWLDIAMREGLNPIAIGLIWNFAAASKLFVYQGGFVILAYSYGYFSASSLLKAGAIITVVEGLFISILAPLYWPLVGLSWTLNPVDGDAVARQAKATTSAVIATRPPEQAPPGYDMTFYRAGMPRHGDGLDDEIRAWASIRDSSHLQEFAEFLKAFPQTRFAFAARMRLRQILRESQDGRFLGQKQSAVPDRKSP